MGTPYLGEVRIFSFDFAPKGWAMCNGQVLPINQNQALFALLGTTYGGDGQTTFALPNLEGRSPLHFDTDPDFLQGAEGGETEHTLLLSEIPAHTHSVAANSSTANQTSPAGNYFANGNKTSYSSASNASMALTGFAGGSQPHDNLSPYLVLNFCIALVGIFPSRN